jgi:5-methyltetrahydrofolate--homocysteine methyltransferase
MDTSRRDFFLETIAKQVIVFDGATGTQVQALDLSDADFGGPDYKMMSDLLVFSRPDDQKNMHLAYLHAGANCVETNTFGASPMRMAEYDFSQLDTSTFAPIPGGLDLRALSDEEMAYHLSKRACEIACDACAAHKAEAEYDDRPLFVIGAMGPSNRVLSPTDADLTPSTFDEITDNFYHQVRGIIDGGADVLLYETQQDILELKAAVMGGLKAMDEAGKRLPIMAQVTVDAFAKMQIFNTDILAALVTMAGTGIDTFGINCSIGPDLMAKTAERLAEYSPLPISIIPNAGLPVSEDGKTVFKFKPEDMAAHLSRFVTEYGVNIVGGCCGTTPDHIRAIADAVHGLTPRARTPKGGLYISGPQEAVLLDGNEGLIRIGERLNVRGSKKVRDAVEGEGDIDQDTLEEVVEEQTQGLGLKVLDVCMDSNVVDTADALAEVIHRQTTNFSGAMCLDSFSVDALEKAIKTYPGRPIVNSFSLEEASEGVSKIQAVCELAQAHDPVYIALCTDASGPAATADGKAELAQRIVDEAAIYGVKPDQILIDMNVFPIGSESVEGMNFALESLEAIPKIKAIHPDLKTTCGVGNLTNGLGSKPYMRKILTSVFLDEGRKRGLDAAIVNPNHYVFVEDLDKHDYEIALRVILEHDMDAFEELEDIADRKKGQVVERRSSYDDLPLEEAICERIKDGFKQRKEGTIDIAGHTFCYGDTIVVQAAEAIKTHEPLAFINTYLMKAMNDLGAGFALGEVSLPHLLKSADVMKQVMGFLEEYMRVKAGVDIHSHIEYKGTIVLGTVYQDVHSIGKDLAKTLFENYGYRVIDLGVMTPLQSFIDAAKEHQADAVGMSALLVQTSNHMITVSKMMTEQGLEATPVLIGGAPVNNRHAAYVAMAGEHDEARMRANVFYCPTAMDGVNAMNTWTASEDHGEILDHNRHTLLQQFERATKKAAEDEKLLVTLPQREPDMDLHTLPKDPWFAPEKVHYTLEEFRPFIDTRTLFALNWKYGGTGARSKRGETEEVLQKVLNDWIIRCTENNWIQPQGLRAVFPCQSEGQDVIVYDVADREKELARFSFAMVIGSGKEDKVCAADYFYSKSSGKFDALGVQIATCGAQVDDAIAECRERKDSEATLYLQGMSDRCAEDLGDQLHASLRKELGFDEKHGIRWSPGYPAIPDTTFNAVICELTNATEELGVQVTEAGEFSPTGSTAAVVSFHPQARYT